VAAASVTLSPGGFGATVDASGRAVFDDLPEDHYQARASAPGFAPGEGQADVPTGGKSQLGIALDPCVSGGGHQYRVGFDTSVTLTPRTTCGSTWEEATFTWTQLEGPDIRDSVLSWSSAKVTFRTRKLEEVRPLPDVPQILSFSHDEAGEYVFQVVARSKDGTTSRDYVLVTSTNVTTGMSSVPPRDIYTMMGEKEGPWRWEWGKESPKTWPETLSGESTRTPSMEPVPLGPVDPQDSTVVIRNTCTELEIQNGCTALEFSFVVAPWNYMNPDCSGSTCHTALQESWGKTRHATSWRKLLDGELVSARGPAAEACASCHALGYDRSAKNGGYDDVADGLGVSFPTVPKKGNYDALPASLKLLGRIHCLACHGPARVDPPIAPQPGRFSAGVCARCHDRKPEQDLVAQWRTTRMSRITDRVNGPEARDDCARCHSAQGFYYGNFTLGRPPSPDVGVTACCENLQPVTCQTCHSPMYAKNKAQVFRYGAVTTRGGLKLKDAGSGALCATCHTLDHDTGDPRTLAQRLAPHSPQADLSYGRGGYVLPAPDLPPLEGIACARTAGEGCVTCHMDKGPPAGQPGYRTVGAHTFRMTSSEGVPNVRPCQACHEGRQTLDPRAAGDYDGDGRVESIRDEVDGLMTLLKTRLAAAIAERAYVGCDAKGSRGVWFKSGYRNKVTVVDALGFDLGDCDRNGVVERREQPFLFPEADARLHQAAYNYLFIELDKSRGLHNPPYAVKLLQRTVYALSAGKNLPRWDVRR
jgi:hypothetical protein